VKGDSLVISAMASTHEKVLHVLLAQVVSVVKSLAMLKLLCNTNSINIVIRLVVVDNNT